MSLEPAKDTFMAEPLSLDVVLWDLGFRVWGMRFRVKVLGFNLRFEVLCLVFEI